jgi:hypothetical protein
MGDRLGIHDVVDIFIIQTGHLIRAPKKDLPPVRLELTAFRL